MHTAPLASLQGRYLHLPDEDGGRYPLPLDSGGSYRLIAHDSRTAQQLGHALQALPGVQCLSADGGLLSHLTVAENLSLAMEYGRPPDPDYRADWRKRLGQLLALCAPLCGLAPQDAAYLVQARPMGLDGNRRFLAGLLRHLLQAPEVLVLDRIFAGLPRKAVHERLALLDLFATCHPFRPLLYLEADALELPALPDCRREIRLSETACPC